ncbi:3-oxoacyl-[acyl-carrier-protein] synthase III C-terminal domain-containing protein [Nocardia asteroides]|uniref:3-oxoacyl-[acyl-carrier-protein] synthase III C-terminal domain-containing protein n=1 Tax=Nocardia asteroides TaxID=1824 RepID=UPI001E5BE40D|nr:3-oxoacyl-[acyl-carrier-protein] synthase III C-terminal domain-containing protein [Nocardia asteroides]UGT61030.1 hypothetical protein LTT61_28465 [Nocardia asteroides]
MSHYLREQGLNDFRIKVYEKFLGFREIREAEQIDPAEHLVRAVERLEGWHDNRHRVRHLLQARATPTATPYPVDTVQDVRNALGLNHAAAFCMHAHACASALLAVDLAGRLLAADGDTEALALVVTGEKVFTTSARVIPDVGVMGECTVALLVGLNGPNDRVLSYVSEIRGDLGDAVAQSYPQLLATVVLAAVHRAGLAMDDIDMILPHNINRMSWGQVIARLDIGMDRVHTPTMASAGHCFGADTFLNYLAAVESGALQRGMRYVMTSVGDVEMYSAMVFEH